MSSGCRRMTKATGMIMASTTPASAKYPKRHPKLSTIPVIAIGVMMPASETPAEPIARAHPRRTMNHFISVALITRPLNKFTPSALLMAWNKKKNMIVPCKDNPTRPKAQNAAPASMRRRGPRLSTNGPITTTAIAPKAVARETAAANCHTLMSNSLTSGSKKTPDTIWPVLVAVNCANIAPTKIHQP